MCFRKQTNRPTPLIQTIVVFLALVAAPSISAQDVHGTIIILTSSQDKVVVAADSLETLGDGSQGGIVDCKIAILNEQTIVFVAAGRFHHTSSQTQFTWDSYSLAREAASKPRSEDLRPVKAVAEEWSSMATAMHNRDADRGVIPSNANAEIESAVFVGVESGTPVAYLVSINKVQAGAGSPKYQPTVGALQFKENRIFPFGIKDIAREYSARETERAKNWQLDFTREFGTSWAETMAPLAERVAELTVIYSTQRDYVRGPIDVVAVDVRGIHWVKKKETCPRFID